MTQASGGLPGLEVAVRFGTGEVVVAIRGEIDLATEGHLEAVMNAVTTDGPTRVVVDLAGVAFMSAHGSAILADTSGRLAAGGGRLALRSPSGLVSRVIDILGLGPLLEVEPPDAASSEHGPNIGGRVQEAHLSAEQPAADPGGPAEPHPPRIASRQRNISFIPPDADVIDGVLRLVVALARATVAGADGVSVSLARHGRLTTVAASDETVSAMDSDQYATGEGPCIDASTTGRWFHAESLTEENRWPTFTPKAAALGVNAILSTPLLAADRPIGALNIYSRTAKAFTTNEQELASTFAAQTATILAEAGATVTDQEIAQRVDRALRTRDIIAQAQGVVMDREGLNADEAHATLRRLSLNRDQPLAELAAEIVASTQRRHGAEQRDPDA
ncbi:MAG: anti-sigma factor antagonist [Acidimicrobiaceae bacterium]|nr:anti-sigma factor antagonist [Acidimicrobiaceae bacterium]